MWKRSIMGSRKTTSGHQLENASESREPVAPCAQLGTQILRTRSDGQRFVQQRSNGQRMAETAHLPPIVRAHGYEETIDDVGKGVHEPTGIRGVGHRDVAVEQLVEQVVKLLDAKEQEVMG